MQRSRLKKNKAISEINVVPFIDVMLVLLVIFMVAAPLLTTGVKVQLPKAAAKALHKDKPWTISIKQNNKIYLNTSKSAISLQDLQQQITAQLRNNHSQQFLLQAEKTSKYAQVATTLAAIQRAGAKFIGILTVAR